MSRWWSEHWGYVLAIGVPAIVALPVFLACLIAPRWAMLREAPGPAPSPAVAVPPSVGRGRMPQASGPASSVPPLPSGEGAGGEASPQPRTWTLIASWSGRGIKQTEIFEAGEEWALEWRTAPGSEPPANFAIEIYSAAGEWADLAANVIGEGRDVSYYHRGGSYYLKIMSGQPWEIAVWERR